MTAATTGSEAEGKPQRACKGKRYKEMVAESGLKSFKRERKVKNCEISVTLSINKKAF